MNDNLPDNPLLPDGMMPGAWDLAAPPTVVPINVEAKAIQKFLSEGEALPAFDLPLNESVVPPALPLALPPIELNSVAAASESAPPVEEFKPTDEEWQNVKERETPHLSDPLADAKDHPAYKPELLERDTEGADDGDWHEVEPGK